MSEPSAASVAPSSRRGFSQSLVDRIGVHNLSLIAALIAVAGITAMQAVGGSVTSTFNKVDAGLKTTTPAASSSGG